jgi:DNA polymerase (family 10)
MENKEIARLLWETADLLEIAGEDGFRVRSYRNAGQSVENWTTRIADIVNAGPGGKPDVKAIDKQLTEIPGIGKSMAGHLRDIVERRSLVVRDEILKKFPPTILDLLQIRDLGAKRIALIWSTYQAGSVDEVEKLAKAGKIAELPRMGAKLEQNLLKAIAIWKSTSGRFHINVAEDAAEKLRTYLLAEKGVTVTIAGSLRRRRETIGDLDLLVTGGKTEKQIERMLAYPEITDVVARGENKVSVRIGDGMHVDVRFLEPESYGSAMQYFTGSKDHNVAVRQRALRLGYTLNEYGLVRLKDEKRVAGKTEEEIYKKLGLDYIPPELRENTGEIDAAENHTLPALIDTADLRGDVHMHTTATDGRASTLEMAQAAQARGLDYVAITDHSKALAMANGLDEKRIIEQIAEIRKVEKQMTGGFRILAGCEVDILKDGALDLADDALAELDVVIGSVHSYMNLEPREQTDRLLRACENRYLRILGHPTGRQLLHRDPYPYDFERVVEAAAARGIHMEINCSPERLDLNERNARICKERGIKIVISTDAHHPNHLANAKFGVGIARRAWLEKGDVLNTLPAAEFLQALKHGTSRLVSAR